MIPAASPEESLALLHGTDVDLLDAAIVECAATLQSRAHPDDRAELLTYAPETITVQVRSEEAAFLVLADAYYPGWTATIDGVPTPVYATNHLLRGVAVPPGEHVVTFAFAPSSWRNGSG